MTLPRTLFWKLALVLVLLVTIMAVLYALISLTTTRHYLSEVSQNFNRDLARKLVEERNLVQAGQLNQAELKATFHHYMTINPSIEIYLLDAGGNILAYSAEPGKVKRERVSLAPIKAFLASNNSLVLGDDPRDQSRQKAFSVTPIPGRDNTPGYLYVVLRGEQYDAVNQVLEGRYFMRLSGGAVAVTLAFGLVVGLVLFHLLTRRLDHLTALMERFRASNLTDTARYRLPPARKADEIDQLGLTFNEMADRITRQLAELQAKDSLRRELVAHISHDLRTPLASLQGYLETLQMKDASLTGAERAEYVAIALRQSERLTRLVKDLFELARLDAQQGGRHDEPFVPAELIQDVLQKFQLQARERGVTLRMEHAPGISLVLGEIRLIERVLENLIENALQHTPEGGTITVSLTRQDDGVHFQVADTGKGIPAPDLPRIFEHFFRGGEKHRGGAHAGLGLAIAKRILELHDSAIRVDSEVNVGTRFSFYLPCS